MATKRAGKKGRKKAARKIKKAVKRGARKAGRKVRKGARKAAHAAELVTGPSGLAGVDHAGSSKGRKRGARASGDGERRAKGCVHGYLLGMGLPRQITRVAGPQEAE